MLEVDSLWKVFGPGNHERAIELARTGASRAEIADRTGQTVGVRDVSFSVGLGETFVVMGLSGSGKSTLIRCLARLNDPSAWPSWCRVQRRKSVAIYMKKTK